MGHHDSTTHKTSAAVPVLSFIAGAGTAMLAVGYYLKTPEGKRKWQEADMKLDALKSSVLEQMRDVTGMTRDDYEKLVDDTVDRLGKMKHFSQDKIRWYANRLKRDWYEMRKIARESAEQVREDLEDA